MSCVQTFSQTEISGSDLQKIVNEKHPNYECESCICSQHSPRPVADGEALLFLLINPTHFDEKTGQLHPIAFQEIHNRDLSLIRRDLANKELIDYVRNQIVERSMQRVPPQYRYVNQGAVATAKSLREVHDKCGRLFAIYDTALQDNKAHASAHTRTDILSSKPGKMLARQALHRIFSKNIVSLEIDLSSFEK